jgi:chemotaxis protein histidine kinase CheA
VGGGELPPRRPTIILESAGQRAAVVVDALLGQQEIVVEPFDPPRGMLPVFSGATILADGEPALILDAAALV